MGLVLSVPPVIHYFGVCDIGEIIQLSMSNHDMKFILVRNLILWEILFFLHKPLHIIIFSFLKFF